MPRNDVRQLTHAEWIAEATKLFGTDPLHWRFKCPCCGHIQTPADFKAAGADPNLCGFSCIGRWTGVKREAFGGDGPGPCNYAGGGLFRIHPVIVSYNGTDQGCFEFAPREEGAACA